MGRPGKPHQGGGLVWPGKLCPDSATEEAELWAAASWGDSSCQGLLLNRTDPTRLQRPVATHAPGAASSTSERGPRLVAPCRCR